MADNSKIGWTDATWNPIRVRRIRSVAGTPKVLDERWGYHCEKVSPGCKNCYAERMNGRMLPAFGTGLEYTVPNRERVEVFLDQDELHKPLSWRKPRRIFVESMSDLFGDWVPDEMIDQVFAVMARAGNHTFQLLTKRAERMSKWATGKAGHLICEYMPGFSASRILPLQNVWMGVSVEDQQRADERIPHLLRTPAAVRFLSVEPMLEPVDLSYFLGCRHQPKGGGGDIVCNVCGYCEANRAAVGWVIVGCESGAGNVRPMEMEWARSIKDQCVAAGVPFFLKQAYVGGKLVETPLLDGQQWQQFPEVRR